MYRNYPVVWPFVLDCNYIRLNDSKCLTYLLILQFDPHHTEGVVSSVVVDVDTTEALLTWLNGDPFLTGVIVDHHRGPGLANALFTVKSRLGDVSFTDQCMITCLCIISIKYHDYVSSCVNRSRRKMFTANVNAPTFPQ